MLACFFQGLTCFLLASTSRSLQIFLRVLDGSMMSSTKPKTKHLAGQKQKCVTRYVGVWSLHMQAWRRQIFWSATKVVRKFTSDSSWEGVGELLHVFGLCLSLVLLSSEDNLDSTLGKRERNRPYTRSNQKEGKKKKKEWQMGWVGGVCTLAPMTATSAVGQA